MPDLGVDHRRGLEIDARVTERNPVKALTEQPPRMRRRAVIVTTERSAALARRFDVLEVAALGGVAGERPTLQRRFLGGGLDRDIAGARVGEPVRPDTAAGEIVGGEFVDRQDIAELRGERVGRVVVLMRTLEGGNPQGTGSTLHDRPTDCGSRRVEMVAQPARGVIEKPDRFETEQRRGSMRLGSPAGDARRVPGPLPRPQCFGRGDSGRQIKDGNPGIGGAGARYGDAAGNDLVIGMRRQNQYSARLHQAAARTAALCQTGSRSSTSTSAQLGTQAST